MARLSSPKSALGGRLPSSGIRHEHSLTKLGYHIHESNEKRDAALDKAVKRYGYQKTVSKLVALEVVNKKRDPVAASTLRADIAVLQHKHLRHAKKG